MNALNIDANTYNHIVNAFTDIGNIQTDSATKSTSEAKRNHENWTETIVATMDEIRFCGQIEGTTLVQLKQSESLSSQNHTNSSHS